MGPTCLVDTTEISLPNGDVCGGLVQNLQISPDGGLLTIMFKCTNYIAVCKMSISCTVLRIYPRYHKYIFINPYIGCKYFVLKFQFSILWPSW